MGDNRATSPDAAAEAAEEARQMYASGGETMEEIQDRYPNWRCNHHPTLPFADLYQELFDPLSENKSQPARRGGRSGTHGATKMSNAEQRQQVIDRFISRWRAEVGNDFYPALRLILPDKDRDRGVYGLKEANIAKLLVKIMGIDKDSEDGQSLINWKNPGKTAATRLAGDFAGRCYEAILKRSGRTDNGDMRIGEVNVLLDELAGASGEKEQEPILQTFYHRMNPKEMTWLIRIILKQMKVGATERTFLKRWHENADDLFNVSSSLRRVCWELSDPSVRLEGDEKVTIELMECFQPQLAQFQTQGTFDKMVTKLLSSTLKYFPEDRAYWIEEKLDGERMQMHMVKDDSIPGGFRFAFWSRKGKDYTYLYGDGFNDDNASLTRHLKDAFQPFVHKLILDGEMIEWDPKVDKTVAFGTLKSAAIAGQRNPHDENAPRPVFRVFDILLLNNLCLTDNTLKSRREYLQNSVKDVPRRLEIHPIKETTDPKDIEPELRTIIATAGEGLVLKNPNSIYRLNSRNDDWYKVKPEYMSEFGESLDCVILGGYYGTGRRGGSLSSYMCGLRVSENDIKAGADPEKCVSFFKVGGGFKATDYAEIRHHTDGKWKDWDTSKYKANSKYIELGGGELKQNEKPDVWIRPSESIVLSVKAAAIIPTDQFAIGWSLRFPRFKKIRFDKNWNEGMTTNELKKLQDQIDQKEKDDKAGKAMVMETRRKTTKRVKRELVIAGQDENVPLFQLPLEPRGMLFAGLDFCVMSEALKPIKKSKPELETLIRENGGKVWPKADPGDGRIVIAERKLVPVASLIKKNKVDIIRPLWLMDCIGQKHNDVQGFLLPYEPRHLFHATEATAEEAEGNVDQYGDSYCRDVDVDELREIIAAMPTNDDSDFDEDEFIEQLEEHGHSLGNLWGRVFQRCHVHFVCSMALEEEWHDLASLKYENYVEFGRGTVAEEMDENVTHIVVIADDERSQRETAAEVRAKISVRNRPPRVVLGSWVLESWENKTQLDEEAYSPPA